MDFVSFCTISAPVVTIAKRHRMLENISLTTFQSNSEQKENNPIVISALKYGMLLVGAVRRPRGQ